MVTQLKERILQSFVIYGGRDGGRDGPLAKQFQ